MQERRLGKKSRGSAALRGTILYAGGLGFDTILSLATLAVVTRLVSIDTFSLFALFQVAVQPLLPLVDLGCGTSIVRDVANTADPARRAQLQVTLLASRAVIAFVVSALIAGIAPLFLPDQTTALRLFAAAFFLWTFSLACGDALRARERHGIVAASFVVRAISRTVVTILLVRAGYGLEGLLLGLGLSWGASVVVLLLALRDALRARPSVAMFKGFLGFGAPAAGYYVTRNLGHLDRHLVRAGGHLQDAGLYQLAATPTQAIDMLEFGASLAIEPFVFGAGPGDLPGLMDRVFRWAATGLLGMCIVIGMLGPETLAVLGPETYRPALGALPWLAYAATLRALIRVFGYSVRGRETRTWLVGGIIEIVLAAGLIVLVIGHFGPTGAAISRFGAVLIALLATIVVVDRESGPRDAAIRAIIAALASAAALAAIATPLGTVAPLWLRGVAGLALLAGTFALIRPPRRRSASHAGDEPLGEVADPELGARRAEELQPPR